MAVYVDMDGVLANFNKATCKLFGLTYPTRSRLHHTWVRDESGVSLDRWFDSMAADPDVWDRIEPFPWTPKLVQCLDIHAPEWKILSAATQDPRCWSSKAAWVTKRLFPVANLHRFILVGGRKYELAQRGDVLIDDYDENVEQWRLRGGEAFKWIEWTDDMTEEADRQIEELRRFLISRKGLQ